MCDGWLLDGSSMLEKGISDTLLLSLMMSSLDLCAFLCFFIFDLVLFGDLSKNRASWKSSFVKWRSSTRRTELKVWQESFRVNIGGKVNISGPEKLVALLRVADDGTLDGEVTFDRWRDLEPGLWGELQEFERGVLGGTNRLEDLINTRYWRIKNLKTGTFCWRKKFEYPETL